MPQNPAVTIYENFIRPAADIVKQFEVPTGYIIDVQGRRGALDSGIKPLFEFPATETCWWSPLTIGPAHA